jgi:hypothetical protein
MDPTRNPSCEASSDQADRNTATNYDHTNLDNGTGRDGQALQCLSVRRGPE